LLVATAKGFNETLLFNYKIFEKTFPGANKQWFDPKVSWRNKYEGGNPDNGPKFFLSTSAFVMFTDQYHLNNFIQKTAIMSALVIKIGAPKQPFRYYVTTCFGIPCATRPDLQQRIILLQAAIINDQSLNFFISSFALSR
jgi:hypothetical protein